MKYIKRNKSIITNKATLEHLFTFKKFPVFIGATSDAYATDVRAEMSFSICRDSGLIQLDKVLPLDIVYSQYHSEALGGIWLEHHLKFIKFLSKFNPVNILEVGGSNGFMAKEYIKNKKVKQWIIVDPNPAIKSKGVIKVIPKLFDEKILPKEEIDIVMHSHLIEHLYYPRDFLRAVSKLLKPGSLNVFSVPNLYEYLKNNQSNTMNFEHTIFLTEYFIDYLLKVYGFEIIEKKYFQKHSIFYATKKTTNISIHEYTLTVPNKYTEYRRMFKSYISYCNNFVKDINKKANTFDGEIYMFGGHVFSQLLINLGITKSIKGILDNSKIKQGKRLYGTRYAILSPETVKNKKNIAVILRVGAYQDEVRKQLKQINKQIVFWE